MSGSQSPWDAFPRAEQPAADNWDAFPKAAEAEERPGAISRAASSVGDFLSRAGRYITGEGNREFDYPELGTSGPEVPPFSREGLTMAGAYALTPDPNAIADIALKTLPGAERSEDRFGNPVVTWRGQSYYVNRPGISSADMFKLLADVAQFTPAARLSGMAAGRFAGAGLAGVGGALTSVAQDAGAQALGSDQTVDLGRAAVTGGTMAVARGLQPEIDRFVNWLTTRGRGSALIDSSGRLTERGRAAARAAGLDPDAITDDLAKSFAAQAQGAANPQQAAAVAEAQSLPRPVRLTQGQSTGDPGQQMFENLAEKGTYGQGASTFMRGVRGQTQDDLAANASAIQQRVGGGQAAVAAPGQGGAAAQQRLVGLSDRANQMVDLAYEGARAYPPTPMDPRAMTGAITDVMRDLRVNHTLTGLPRTSAVADDLVGLVDKDPRNPTVLIREIFDWRKRATAAKAAGGEEAVAINRMIRGVDGFLDDALNRSLLSGDEAAIELFRTANRLNRQVASVFRDNDLVARLVAREPRGGSMQLSVAPDQATNVIFGSNRLFGGTNTVRDLTRLRSVLGQSSPEWNALREEAWLRLVRAGQGPMNPETATQAFSGANFARAFNNAMTDARPIMNVLFTPEERALMTQFRNVASRATGTVRGGDNFSNTTVAASNILQRLASTLFVSESAAQRFLAVPLIRSIYQAGVGLGLPGAIAPGVAPAATVGGAMAPSVAGSAGGQLSAPRGAQPNR